ncbi:MAG: hypothetical protein IKK01_06515, partial [Clostridia bacterium]|nr:hypothetical protein [Clostridia bacterium]
AHCRRAKYEKDCHVVHRQSLIFLHLSHFSQKNKAYLALEIDFVSDLNGTAVPFLIIYCTSYS